MPKNNKKRGNRKRKNGRKAGSSTNSLVYTGPYRPLQNIAGTRSVISVLNYATQTIASDGAGAIAGNIGIGNPSGAASWAKLAAVYDEFRVLSCRIQFNPVDRYDAPLAVTTSVNQPPLLVLIDRDSSNTPANAAAAAGYESCRQVSLSDPWVVGYKMAGVREAVFVTTATPTSSPARGFEWISNAPSATISTTFGYLFLTWLVQFRGIDV